MLNSTKTLAPAGSGLARARDLALLITSALLTLILSTPRLHAAEVAPAVVTIVAMDSQASESGPHGATLLVSREGGRMDAPLADAGARSGGTPSPHGTTPPPALPHDRTGTLLVTMTFEGTGSWKHPRNGAYSNLKFHRTLTYTVPLIGLYSPGSGFTAVDQREPAGAGALPNLKRFLVLTPRDQLLPVPRVCGRGTADYLDESSGMEVGLSGSRVIENFNVTGGPDHSTFPLRATVKWQVTFQ